jgi:putative oxidoreductase
MLMMGHGAQKLFGSFGGHGPAGTGGFFESLGLTPGRQMAILAGVGELVGGALLALGLLTPLSAALLSAVLLTAAWTAHRAAGIWVTEGGYEYNLVLITGLFASPPSARANGRLTTQWASTRTGPAGRSPS